jgi:hypothetical protein
MIAGIGRPADDRERGGGTGGYGEMYSVQSRLASKSYSVVVDDRIQIERRGYLSILRGKDQQGAAAPASTVSVSQLTWAGISQRGASG